MRYRVPAVISSVVVTIAAFAIFIWALAKQGNGGPLFKNPEAIYGVGHLTGARLSWTIMRMVTSGIGGWAGGVHAQAFSMSTDFSQWSFHTSDSLPKWYVISAGITL